MSLTHQDVEPGMDVLVCPGRPSDERGWFLARVLKSMSRGAQVRYLAGPHEGREVSVPLNRVRLVPATKPKLAIAPPPPKPYVVETAFLPARAGDDAPKGDDVSEQVSAWLEMGRELAAPLERRRAELDDEIEWCAQEIARIEEHRAALGAERARVDTQINRIRKLTVAS